MTDLPGDQGPRVLRFSTATKSIGLRIRRGKNMFPRGRTLVREHSGISTIPEFQVLTAPNDLCDKLLSKPMLGQQHPPNTGQPLHGCQSVIISQHTCTHVHVRTHTHTHMCVSLAVPERGRHRFLSSQSRTAVLTMFSTVCRYLAHWLWPLYSARSAAVKPS